MKKLIPATLSESENADFTGFSGEIVGVASKGVALHDGVNKGGLLLTNSLTDGFNYVRNGNFNIQQNQPTSGSFFPAAPSVGSSQYIYDGWFIQASGGSKSNVAAAYYDVEQDVGMSLRTSVTTGGLSSSFTLLSQRIAGVNRFLGKTLTLSFKAKANKESRFALEAQAKFDNSGEDMVQFISNDEIGTSWKQYAATFTLPAMQSYSSTVGRDNHLALYFWVEAGSDWDSRTGGIGEKDINFNITNIKLESGDKATPFIFGSYSDEFQRVAQYYEKIEHPLYFSAAPLSGNSADTVVLNVKTLPKRRDIIVGDITANTDNVSSTSFKWFDISSFSMAGLATSSTNSAVLTDFIVNQEITP